MKPLLLVFNKCDAPATVSQSDLELVLSLSDLQRVLKSQLNVMEVSAVTGHGVPAMLDWMVKTGAVTVAPSVQQQQLMPQQQPAIGAFSPVGYGADLGKALKSVCKVFATTASPNYATPWQMHAQSKSTASGFVIAPISQRRILTNAHAVANQVQVQLRKHGNAKKFTAKVLSVGHECDIAMLTVEDEEFWTGVEALDIGGLPGMQESVSVVGYPTGGDNVCVTKGVVSRIDRQQYSHGRTSLLALQIDAAINSGNSGGPVIKGDKVIGIAFQCLTQGENIGYVIPVPVIHHFLEDLARHNGRYTGFCELGASWQTLESADHKLALHMPPSLTGVFITSVEPTYYAAQVLRPGDVITHFNGHSIADDGTFLFEHAQHVHPALSNRGSLTTTMLPALSLSALPDSVDTLSKDAPSAPFDMAVSLTLDRPRAQPSLTAPATSLGQSSPFSTNASPAAALTAKSHPFAAPAQQNMPAEVPAVVMGAGTLSGQQHPARIDFRHLTSMHFDGDVCTLGIWRDGAALPGGVQVCLTPPKQLVPVHSHDEKPHYFIFGGLVFTRLTNFYLRSTYGVDWTHKAPIKLCDRSFAGFLEHEGQECVILSKVLAWDCNAGYQDLGNVEVMTVAGVRVHSLEHLAHLLDNAPGPYVRLDLQWHKVVLLDVRKARAAAADILAQNCIPGNGSYPKDLAKRALNLPPHLALATDKALGRLPAVAPLDEVPLLAAPKPSTSTSSALALQLQQLDLTGTSILQAQQPDQTGAVTLATLFQGLRLKRLSLDVDYEDMPSLQPLAQHLTQLHIGEPEAAPGDAFTTAVGSLPLLQVLVAAVALMA
ncbi:PDZ_3 domain-containing protein [Haematococcus lacustris]|uniref:PDZ_3 domain-containing protein n=1 Tax=Haematococcus lacustris TaxID=44745 RepID=A0A699ZCY3_HAELA|nr:PDZ_3 domain-containing protein [Haematococcus lacustris]